MPYKIRPQKKKDTTAIRIASRSEALIEQIVSHPLWVWSGIGVLLVIGVTIFAFQAIHRSAEEAAWTIEAEASRLFHEPPPLPEPIEEGKEEEAPLEMLNETDRLEKSASLYEEVLEKHPNSSAAMVALFGSGNVYVELDLLDKAEAQYLSFIQKYPNNDRLVLLSHLRLAYLYQKKGDQSAAIALFRKVYEMPNADNRDQAGFELARTLELNGKEDEAKTLYEKLSEDFSETPWGTEAKARFLLLAPPAVPETDSTESDPVKEGSEDNLQPEVEEVPE